MPVSTSDNGKRINHFDDKTVVFYSYSLNATASAQSLASLMNSLSKQGYKLHLITYGAPAGDDYITADDVERHVLANLENDGMPSSVSFLRILGSIPAKTVVLWGTFTKRMYQCYLAAKSLGRAVILYQTASPVQPVSSGAQNLSIMYANTIVGCESVITPCDSDAVIFKGMGAADCNVIPFYFPYDSSEVSPSSVEKREIAFFTNYAGRNTRNIITAFALIHKKYPDSNMHMILMNSVKPGKAVDNLYELVNNAGLGDSFLLESKVLKPLRALRTAGVSITYAHCEHMPQTVMESITAGIPAILALDSDYSDSSLECDCINASDIQGVYNLLDKYMSIDARIENRDRARINLSTEIRNSIVCQWTDVLDRVDKNFELKANDAARMLGVVSSALNKSGDYQQLFSSFLNEKYDYCDLFGAMLLNNWSAENIISAFEKSGLFAGNNYLESRFKFKNVISKSLKMGRNAEEAVKEVKKGIFTGFEILAMMLFCKINVNEICLSLGIPGEKYLCASIRESYYLINCLFNNEVRADNRLNVSTSVSYIYNLQSAMRRFENFNHSVLKFRSHHFVRKSVNFHKWVTSPWDFKNIIQKIICSPIYARVLIKRKLLLLGKKRQNKRKVTEVKSSDTRKIQLLVMLMLIELDRICKKYNLTYYIAGGSILGAVRHKGFIPWDDDIDITMPRPDYDKFIKVAQKELPDEFYLDKDCVPFCHNRIEIRDTDFTTFWRKGAVFLDILALEGSPDDEVKRLEHERKCKFWRSCMLEKARPFPVFDFSTSKKIKRYICCTILKFVPRWFIKKNWERWAKKYSTEETSSWVCLPASIYTYEQERFPKEYWGEPVYLDFEGMKLPTMSHWEDYLICHFGDYMKMPPETTRKSHHFIYSYSLGKYDDMTTDEIERIFLEKKLKYMKSTED